MQGIETVRRDVCPAVSRLLEQSVRRLFTVPDLSAVRTYLVQQWTKMLASHASIQDFVLCKAVRCASLPARLCLPDSSWACLPTGQPACPPAPLP